MSTSILGLIMALSALFWYAKYRMYVEAHKISQCKHESGRLIAVAAGVYFDHRPTHLTWHCHDCHWQHPVRGIVRMTDDLWWLTTPDDPNGIMRYHELRGQK